MTSADALPLAAAFPADDEMENARWLVGLIAALRSHADRSGHPEVATALDDALATAQAIVDGTKRH